MIVDHFGDSTAFLSLGTGACGALAALFMAMPETAPAMQQPTARFKLTE